MNPWHRLQRMRVTRIFLQGRVPGWGLEAGWAPCSPPPPFELLGLLQVLLKLFSYCVKVKVNRQQLVKLEMNTLNVMLGTLNLVRWG